MGLKEDFELFCSGTSLRGMARTVKAPTRPLRVIWSAYVILMAASLVTCVCFIIVDYLSYKTVIQTTMVLNDPSSVSWPAVTVCGQYPFSESGRKLWSSGRIPTPTNFSRNLRQAVLKLFNAGDILNAEELLASDSKRIYYQNIDPADAEMLGHSVQQLFIFCISGTGSYMELSSGIDCGFKPKLISLPDYFNCFQVQAPPKIDWLTLVLRVAGSRPVGPHEEAFVQDVFQQASGFRVQLQEHDRYPEPTDKGIHVAPGKMVEIAFQPVRWLEVGSPSDLCLSEADSAGRRVRDLGLDFAYSHEGCLRQAMGRWILRACGCHYADCLRETPPNASHPYCGDFRRGVDAVMRNSACLQAINLTNLRSHLSDTECLKPCHYHDFEMVHSKTVWRSTSWQLYWLQLQTRSFRELDDMATLLASTSSPAERREAEEAQNAAKEAIARYLSSDNLTLTPRTPSALPEGEDFAYVTVRRKSRNIVQKAETLSLSLSALMSQVGGLSSLFLGLTCAFVVELMELGLLKRHYSKTAERSRAEAANNSLMPQQQSSSLL